MAIISALTGRTVPEQFFSDLDALRGSYDRDARERLVLACLEYLTEEFPVKSHLYYDGADRSFSFAHKCLVTDAADESLRLLRQRQMGGAAKPSAGKGCAGDRKEEGEVESAKGIEYVTVQEALDHLAKLPPRRTLLRRGCGAVGSRVCGTGSPDAGGRTQDSFSLGK